MNSVQLVDGKLSGDIWLYSYSINDSLVDNRTLFISNFKCNNLPASGAFQFLLSTIQQSITADMLTRKGL